LHGFFSRFCVQPLRCTAERARIDHRQSSCSSFASLLIKRTNLQPLQRLFLRYSPGCARLASSRSRIALDWAPVSSVILCRAHITCINLRSACDQFPFHLGSRHRGGRDASGFAAENPAAGSSRLHLVPRAHSFTLRPTIPRRSSWHRAISARRQRLRAARDFIISLVLGDCSLGPSFATSYPSKNHRRQQQPFVPTTVQDDAGMRDNQYQVA